MDFMDFRTSSIRRYAQISNLELAIILFSRKYHGAIIIKNRPKIKLTFDFHGTKLWPFSFNVDYKHRVWNLGSYFHMLA